jgi:hypothetical protein
MSAKNLTMVAKIIHSLLLVSSFFLARDFSLRCLLMTSV